MQYFTPLYLLAKIDFWPRGRVHITLARRGGGGVAALLTDANRRGRGGLGHVNVSKKPPKSMRTNDVIFLPILCKILPILPILVSSFHVDLDKKAIGIEIVFGSLYVLINFQ